METHCSKSSCLACKRPTTFSSNSREEIPASYYFDNLKREMFWSSKKRTLAHTWKLFKPQKVIFGLHSNSRKSASQEILRPRIGWRYREQCLLFISWNNSKQAMKPLATTLTRWSYSKDWTLLLKESRSLPPISMCTLQTMLLNFFLPDAPFPVLLSTLIRSRFQARPATLLTPIDFAFPFRGGGASKYSVPKWLLFLYWCGELFSLPA